MSENIINPPSPEDYDRLLDRVQAALESRTAGQIDAAAYRQLIDAIDEDRRILDLIRLLHATRRQALAHRERQQKAAASR